jgi:hypothetical protein
MIGYQDADAALAQMPDYSLNIENGNWIDASEGLVEQDEFRLRGERARNFDAPTLTSREAQTEAIADVTDVQLLEQLFEIRLARGAAQVGARLEDREDVVGDAELAEDRSFLGQVPKPEPGTAMDGEARDVLTIEHDVAVIAADEPDDHVESRRLAGTVRAE